jgi:hypothetical protein
MSVRASSNSAKAPPSSLARRRALARFMQTAWQNVATTYFSLHGGEPD